MTFVLPDVREFLDKLYASGEPPPQSISPQAAREQFLKLEGEVDAPAPPVGRIADIEIEAPGRTIPARLYDPVPRDKDVRPVILYFHGGGWMLGDLQTHHSLCAEIAAQTGVSVIAVDYRLSPEHVFPAAHEDCLAAVQWLFDEPDRLGHPLSGIALAGDSAGGCMAAWITQQLRGKEIVPLIAQFLIYPGTDLARCRQYASNGAFSEGYFLDNELIDYFLKAYVPGDVESTGVAMSPLQGSLHGLPPAVVFGCGLDPIRDQARAYAAKLIESGTRVSFHEQQGQIHACFNFRGALPSAQSQLKSCLYDFRTLIEGAG